MTDSERRAAVRAFAEGNYEVAAADLQQWVGSDDIGTLSFVFETVAPRWGMVSGATRSDFDALVHRLLLASLESPQGSATSLKFIDVSNIYVRWLNQLESESADPQALALLQSAVDRLGQLCVAEPRFRSLLTNGVIEHAFESKPLREYFRQWKLQPSLEQIYRDAAEWADDPGLAE